MDKRSTLIIAAVIVVALIGLGLVAYQSSVLNTERDAEIASTTRWMNQPAELPLDVVVTQKTVVTAKHAYKGGEHIIAGEVPMPTPCHILEATATTTEDKMLVLVSLTTSVKTGEMCSQVITTGRFKVDIAANKNAKIEGTLNGQEITLS